MPDKPDDSAWFRPKRLGYGAGLPLRWQGWALLAAYLAMVVPFQWLMATPGAIAKTAGIVLFAVATLAFVLVARAKTQGGWKWRNGAD